MTTGSFKFPKWIRPHQAALDPKDKNADGFTFKAWLKAAGVNTKAPAKLWYQRALKAWRANENPAEWAERDGAPNNRWKLEGLRR